MDDVEHFRDCVAVKATALALLVKIPPRGETWVPQSVISEDSEVWKEGDTGRLVVRRWWAEQEGLDD